MVSYIPFVIHLLSSINLGQLKIATKKIEQIIKEQGNLIFSFNLEIKYPLKNGYSNLAKAIHNS